MIIPILTEGFIRSQGGVLSLLFLMIMKKTKIYIFALAATGSGISGSDRIFIEFARRWSKICPIEIYVWEEGYKMCQSQNLNSSNIKYLVSNMEPWKNFGFIVNYIGRIIEGIKIGLTLKTKEDTRIVIYSASEFWMDSLPAFILKIRNSNIKWVAAWYQTAPFPWKGYSEGNRGNKYHFSALIYWLIQFPIKSLIKKQANLVLINNEEERKVFPKLSGKERAVVVFGAVDINKVKKWKEKLGNQPKIYDAVFQGRFHPQKGVEELVDIWKQVVAHKPGAKLVMIGDGSLMDTVKLKIKNKKLEDNIILTGYLFDGEEKYRIFSQSKLVVHPAFFDSGGMAAAEAMAFGLPCVGFDLKSFKSYYPEGMVKVGSGDIELFAESVVELLNNSKKRVSLGARVLKMIEKKWSWDMRAQQVFAKINSNWVNQVGSKKYEDT